MFSFCKTIMNFCSAEQSSAQGPQCCCHVLPTPRFSLLVAAFGRLFKAFSGFALAGILYSFQRDFRYLGNLLNSQPRWLTTVTCLENGSLKRSIMCHHFEILFPATNCNKKHLTGYRIYVFSMTCLIMQNFDNKYKKKHTFYL